MPTITSIAASAYRVPTAGSEADGTLDWNETTLVGVEIAADGKTGLGFTYADACLVPLLRDKVPPLLLGHDPRRVPDGHQKVARALRNLGPGGLAAMALSAVDMALWDLAAKLLQTPLAMMLGMCRDTVPVYGSGGFTNASDAALRRQLKGWAGAGMRAVKIKVGADPGRDPERVRVARKAVGDATALFVDANGACDVRQALRLAGEFAAQGVVLFEEPVSSDDPDGLRFVRDHAPPGMQVAAGEYGGSIAELDRTLAAIDVLQADLTRCGGVSVFLEAGVLCRARNKPLFCHCGPAFHLAPALALPAFGMIEWFHDHARIEGLLLEGLPALKQGRLHPRLDRPGHGLAWKRAEADKYRVA